MTSASLLPDNPASPVLKVDVIQMGARSLFPGNFSLVYILQTFCGFEKECPGYSEFYQFVYLTLPVLILVHGAVLIFILWKRDDAKNYFVSKTYFWSDRGAEADKDSRIHFLQQAMLSAQLCNLVLC